MASPPEAEDAAGAGAGAGAPTLDIKNVLGEQESTGKRPGRLRVTKPDVEEVLRSPRRARTKKPDAAEAVPAAAAAALEGGEYPSYNCVFQEERKGQFTPPELVWGKVRSHPWWPGQVFDPADASELALKHRRKETSLVAYFSDKTFAWNDASVLRPFRGDFTRLARQSKMNGFLWAVDAALSEVARRVEVGLSCGCFGNEAVKKQEFENAGVRDRAYRLVADGSFMRDAFRPERFLEYISELGQEPLAGADRLDLVIAKAQLRAFNRSRGPRDLPEFVLFGGIDGVAVGPPPAKRKRLEKDDGDDVSAAGAVDAVLGKEKKSRRRESSAHKNEHVSEDDKGLEKDDGGDTATGKDEDAVSGKEKKSRRRKSSARKKEHVSEDEKGLDKDDGDDTATDKDAGVVLRTGKKSRRGESSANKKENISEDGKGLEEEDGGGIPTGKAADVVLSKEKKSRRRESSVCKEEAISEDAKEMATDDDGGMLTGDAPDDVSSKEKKSRRRERSARKKEQISEDANGLEKDDGGGISTGEAADDVLSKEKKTRRRASSARKKENISEDGNGLEKDDNGGISTGEAADDVLSKEKKSRRKVSSPRKKEHISEDGEGLEKDATGGAADALSGDEKSGLRECSAAKRQHISEDGRKKKKLSELMVEKDGPNSAAGGKNKARGKGSSRASAEKHEDPDLDSKDSAKNRKKKKLDTLGDLEYKSPPLSRQKFFKVGELMRRAAGQMSQTPPILKANGAVAQESSRKARRGGGSAADEPLASMKTRRGKKGTLKEYSSSCREMLSQLRLAACDPKKGYSFVPTIVNFFTGFKESHASSSLDEEEISETVASKAGQRKSAKMESAPSEPALADHMQDSYWADAVVNEDPEDEPLSSLQKKKAKGKRRTSKKAKQVKEPAKESSTSPAGRVPNKAPNLPSGSAGSVDNGEEPKAEIEQGSDNGEELKAEIIPCSGNGGQLNAETRPAEEMEESLLTGLVLNFNRPSAVPSGSDLIKIFSQYGPIKEAKTEITTNANRAQVVFKRRADAEAAFAGAGKISALGPDLISFRLSYLPAAAPNGPLQATSQSGKDSPPVQAVH